MAIIQTVEEQLARLGSYNRMYNYNRNNWKYLLVSYLGGDDYRRAGLLTRYQLETDTEYQARLNATPLENHCKAVISVYNSFLFRQQPERDFGNIEEMPEVDDFLEDADLDGRDLNGFMKDVSTWASVFGHCWIMVTKPDIGATTRADEMASGVRPYVSLLTPMNVLDWQFERQANGRYSLKYLKYVEEINGSEQTIKEWHVDRIETWNVNFDNRTLISHEEVPNGLGKIPAVVAYNSRSSVRAMGVPDIADIAHLQQFIYNLTSEVEQTQRMDAHPSLVKTPETQAGTGAGSIISIPENLDPGLKPYLLEYNGASVTSLYEAINHASDAIDKLANTGSVRATTSKTMSGIAMETEFQLLNAKLAEKADNLELAEEQLWCLWCEYMSTTWDGEIKYEDSYSIQDEQTEYTKLQTAKAAATGPEALAAIDQLLIDLVTDDTEYEGKIQGPLDAQVGGDITTQDLMTPGMGENVSPSGAINLVGADAGSQAQSTMSPAEQTPAGDSCPIATQDVAVNLKNRQKAIKVANYGPLNPAQPNRTFWMAKAKIFGTTIQEAKGSRCGNCAAFNVGPKIKACIEQGLAAGGSGSQDAWDVVNQADLGYCEMFDFKCAATRTCDAWVTGGPVTK
jgi:hypothetical protein